VDDDERLQRLRTLTLEQRAILPLLCQQLSRRAIAERRHMTVAGVDYHCTQIAQKLGLQDGAARRNPVEFRLALLEFLPFLLQLDAEPISPASDAEDAAAGQPDATPAADPAVLALVDQLTTLARRGPGELVSWSPPDDRLGAGVPTGLQALRRWWQPLAFLLLLALVAGIAGGVVAAHVIGAGGTVASAGVGRSTVTSPTPALAVATPTNTAASQSPVTLAGAAPSTSESATSSAALPSRSSTAPPSQQPTPAPATATVNPSATPTDLAGTVDSTIPGTPLQLGSTVTSVVDDHTKPRDVYTLPVQAGQRLQVTVTATTWAYSVTLGAQGALPGAAGGGAGELLCTTTATCTKTVPIAAAGSYVLVVQAFGPGVRYTLHAAALPLAVAPDVVNLAGQAASDLPGTPLSVGTTVTSVIDVATKRRDVYALRLTAGQTVQVDTDANRWDYSVLLLPPGATSIAGAAGGTLLCASDQSCHQTAPIAAAGVYTLVVEATGSGVQYTLRATVR